MVAQGKDYIPLSVAANTITEGQREDAAFTCAMHATNSMELAYFLEMLDLMDVRND